MKISKRVSIDETKGWNFCFDTLNGQVAEIIMTNSLRNFLGPHHLQEGESYAVTPSSFYKEDGIFATNWSGELDLWNENYCFVKTGIEGLRMEQNIKGNE